MLASRLSEARVYRIFTRKEPKSVQTGEVMAHHLGLDITKAKYLREHDRTGFGFLERTKMTVIDLSQALQSGMPVYPGDPEVRIKVVQKRDTTGWELRTITMGSHTGTHVDAFSHAHAKGQNLDHIPINRFIGTARCIAHNQDLPPGIGLIFIHHIALGRLSDITEARPRFVGGPSIDEELERELLAMEILTYDGLVNLGNLPPELPFTFSGFPLKIESGDGSPVRAVALID